VGPVLYQSFGSTIQSVTTVVAAYMAASARRVAVRPNRRPHRRPAVLYGAEIAIGVFGVLSPLVLWSRTLAVSGPRQRSRSTGSASVALRFGLALWCCSSPRRSWVERCLH